MNKPLLFGWIVSIVATLGSLYFSEVKHFIPCELCWYQRIFMYPIVLLLGVAFYQNDQKVYKYILSLSVIGLAISTYHTALQKLPSLQGFGSCSSSAPCTRDYINWFGFVTIPILALVAFLLITISMVVVRRNSR